MEKLTLEQIAPYLPYGLRIHRGGRNLLMNTGKGSSVHWVGISAVIDWFNSEMISKPFPILRRLDLAKPIKINGEEKIPIEELAKIAETKQNMADIDSLLNTN